MLVSMTVAHGYFQMQTSLLVEEFHEALNLLGQTAVLQLAGTTDNINTIYTATFRTLDVNQADLSCFDDLFFSHLKLSHDLSKCADQQLADTLEIYNIFQFMAFSGEMITNVVPLRGLEAFQAWMPLTSPAENDPMRFVNDELMWDLMIYRVLLYDFLVMVNLDVHSSLETFENLTRSCVSAVESRFTTETQSILDRASANQCSGQV
jgi:hypothetical protein